MKHKTVLLKESIEGLNLKPNSVCLDCTFGGGGHSKLISEKLGPEGHLLVIDADKKALKEAESILKDRSCKLTVLPGNFRNLKKLIETASVDSLDAVLMDLGTSAGSIEESGRGFTFAKDEPLVMTYKENPDKTDLTAKEILNEWGEESLADIIYGFGGEKYSRRIAKAIIEKRNDDPIESTFDLVSLIEQSVPAWYKRRRIHPATKTFQAIRIAVNDELGALKQALPDAWSSLKPEGRLAVISFHELEARIVKNFFKDKKASKEGVIINKHAIKPTFEEIKENPRSRSAQLRIIEKIL